VARARLVAKLARRARIETCGRKASLNVVAALAIALHELRCAFDARQA
jgi:tRNA G18 (ribose-2'-O)-methylase SpoU